MSALVGTTRLFPRILQRRCLHTTRAYAAVGVSTLNEALLESAKHRHGINFVSRKRPSPDHTSVDKLQNRRVSYSELHESSLRLGRGLHMYFKQRSGHAQYEGRPFLFLQLSSAADLTTGLWGSLYGGCLPAPASVADYGADAAGVSKMHTSLRALDSPHILTCASELDNVRQGLAQGTEQSHTRSEEAQVLVMEEVMEWGREDSVESKQVWTSDLSHAGAPALAVLTSGTTQQPKVVLLRHKHLLAQVYGQTELIRRECGNAEVLSDRTVSLNCFPLYHAGGLLMTHLRDVVLGAEQVQIPTKEFVEDPTLWLDAVHTFRGSASWGPNYFFGLVADAMEEQRQAARQWDLSCMKVMINGGECIVEETLQRFLRGASALGMPPDSVFPAWGMAETASLFSARRYTGALERLEPQTHAELVETPHVSSQALAHRFVSLGHPITHGSVRVVDGEGRNVPNGVVGRVHVRGSSLFDTYFVPGKRTVEQRKPEHEQDTWFDTQDDGFLDEQGMTITGRTKNLLLVNGIFYYLHEVEDVVKRSEHVEETAVCAVRQHGSKREQLAVFYVPREASVAGLSPLSTTVHTDAVKDITALVVKHIGFEPDVVIPVLPSEIPRTSIGKIQHSLLRFEFERGYFDTRMTQYRAP